MTSDLRLKTIKTIPCSARGTRPFSPKEDVAWMGAILVCDSFHLLVSQYEGFSNWSLFKWRYDPRSGNFNLSNFKLSRQKFQDFNWIRTCVSAAVLYQLSYEDAYIMRRPICWITMSSFKFVFAQLTSSSFYISFLSRGLDELNKLAFFQCMGQWVFIAHCSATAEAMGSKSRFFFSTFQKLYSAVHIVFILLMATSLS